ncbi:uncharacterized protein LOC115634829 [Scaptodrosophila lebanonensis]|uniref:Uncharacterized protein LOC115634829 n=1 Tax=Drosophila lebanonensis TaxID=7225 RepID=A0A6J2UJN1_DROLE|nr:uncharacterized protein LOC115634829 [Scaptodrosophila lebanonensis]
MAMQKEISCSLIAVVLCSILGHCEMSVYPGLRRRPTQQQLEPQYELHSDFLAQLMEDNARRRLNQQFGQQLELIRLKLRRQRQLLERERYRQRQQELQMLAESEDDYNNNLNNQQYDQYDNAEADAAYGSPLDAEFDAHPSSYSPGLSFNRNSILRERIPFAVGPNDARFFDNASDPSAELDSRALDDYEEYAPVESAPARAAMGVAAAAAAGAGGGAGGGAGIASSVEPTASSKQIPSKLITPVLAPAPVETPKLLDGTAANFHRIKPQTAAAAAVAGVNLAQPKDAQHEISALIDKLQKQSKTPISAMNSVSSVGQPEPNEQFVLRQHLGMNSEFGVYIVALIAGVSAAVTVGLIALGVTWFHNRTKATADVDYPAYGITGPNKDVSPSGDRKLAQSAQMYHYQHQKQQIIAMENCQAVDGSCGLSDVESDDDNEEGDYTVYECPGLAPTGEMEVKNPLFLDETPATPANNLTVSNNNITQATPQQPATLKKGTVKPNINLLGDEKNKRKNTKK